MAFTLKRFIEQQGITSTAEWADTNPNMERDDWNATHYRVTLRRRLADGSRRQMTVPFSMGLAHTNEPETDDVLDCLAMDASGYENARSFDEWADEYGYDTDSRRAERTYRNVEQQTKKLRRFMDDQYETLLWEVERQ